ATKRVAQRVDAGHRDDLLEGDDVTRTLRQPYLFAAPHNPDELADERLDVPLRIVACAGRHSPEPADVPMMICAEQVDADVEAALWLVDVVSGVRREVGLLAVGPDQHPVPVVSKVRCPHPERAVPFVYMAVVSQDLDAVGNPTAVMEGPLGEPHVEVSTEVVEHCLLLGELASVALFAERGELLLIGQVEDL